VVHGYSILLANIYAYITTVGVQYKYMLVAAYLSVNYIIKLVVVVCVFFLGTGFVGFSGAVTVPEITHQDTSQNRSTCISSPCV
jgi:hypothetical protein